MTTVLIADAERSIRSSLKERLEYEKCAIDTAESADEMLSKMAKAHFDILIFDMTLLNKGGIGAFITHIRGVSPDTAVIILSAVKSVEQAVECMKAGAVDYIVKPIDLSKLLSSIKVIKGNAGIPTDKKSASMQTSEVRSSTVSTPPRPVRKNGAEPEYMIGESEAIKHIKKLIAKVAASDSRVLVMGANGTGKELVARWLHEKSNRMGRAFVEVNCAAIPSELIESELFGHEKGSFTSAIRQRKGKFEQADGGTLFLDEIGDMSLSAQSKMLRALQENRINRIGGDSDINVNVRVIAATNKILTDEIKSRNFREDLYHRLSVIIIRVPSLVERREDIPLLVNHFIDQVCAQQGVARKSLDAKCMAVLQQMDWPGNIRQLRNVVERLIILSEKSITLEDVELYAELK